MKTMYNVIKANIGLFIAGAALLGIITAVITAVIAATHAGEILAWGI